MYNKPRITSNLNKTSSNHDKQWFPSSPYYDGYTPEVGPHTTGKHVRSCPITDDGKTIFTPEWFHGNL